MISPRLRLYSAFNMRFMMNLKVNEWVLFQSIGLIFKVTCKCKWAIQQTNYLKLLWLSNQTFERWSRSKISSRNEHQKVNDKIWCQYNKNWNLRSTHNQFSYFCSLLHAHWQVLIWSISTIHFWNLFLNFFVFWLSCFFHCYFNCATVWLDFDQKIEHFK